MLIRFHTGEVCRVQGIGIDAFGVYGVHRV